MPTKPQYIPDRLILPFSGHRHTEDPIIIESAQGAYLHTTDGRKLYDGNSSLWVANLGHGHTEITDAIRRQLDKMAHTTLFGQAHPAAIELAERLPDFTGLEDYHTFFANSGSEAVEAALKFVINYCQRTEAKTKRKRVVTFHNSYHGETAGAMGASGMDMHRNLYPGLPYETIRVRSPAITEYEKNEHPPEYPSLQEIVDQFDEEIAAVIVEPLHGAGGIIPIPEEELRNIQEICTERDYMLIVDEIATGFYRGGSRFHYEDFNLLPDILILGKGLSAGQLPLSAVLIHPRIGLQYSRAAHAEPLMHGHTFSGNPLACAAALANLDVLSRSSMKQEILMLQSIFGATLRKACEGNAQLHVRSAGLIGGIEVYSEGTKDMGADIALNACNTLKQRGILTRPLGNTVVLAPPYISKPEEMRSFIQETHASLVEQLRHYGQ